jgi:hypothetical protein
MMRRAESECPSGAPIEDEKEKKGGGTSKLSPKHRRIDPIRARPMFREIP